MGDPMTSYTFLILSGIVVFSVIGDYCIKIASDRDGGVMTLHFLIGAALYTLPAFGWFCLMREHSLASIAVLYSASTMVFLVALGAFVFKESYGLREAIGLALALLSVVVMRYEA